jgi:mRNA interferase MazF
MAWSAPWVTICPLTTDPTDAPLFRLEIEASPGAGLCDVSRLMVGKITMVSRSKLGDFVGVLDAADVVRLDRAIVVFLGMASAPA